MNIRLTSSSTGEFRGETLIIPLAEFDKLSTPFHKQLDQSGNGALGILLRSMEFVGKEGEIAEILAPVGFGANRLLLVGTGDIRKRTPESFRRGFGIVSRHRGVMNVKSVGLLFTDDCSPESIQASVEGLLLGSFRELTYKTGIGANGKFQPTEISVLVPVKAGSNRLQQAIDRGVIIAEGQNLARHLKELPSNDLTPTRYAETIRQLGKEHRLTVRILDEQQIAKEKMGGLLGVARGSAEPPRFVIVEYRGGSSAQRPIVLVGKGVTFDTGGISIKPAADMGEMKQDMAGSATMLATIITAARLGIKQHLVALLPLTENMPSGTAFKPGDILTMRKGKTVEITNTDAEGRLILADALDYANKFEPQAVIDIATLTGAARYILGYAGAPIMGNSERLLEQISAASVFTGEKTWPLPIWPEYLEQMKSGIADLVNSGPPVAGTLAAAAFLEQFIGAWPWAHIDIAYVDLEKGGKHYYPKGATGFGVRLLVELLTNWKKVA